MHTRCHTVMNLFFRDGVFKKSWSVSTGPSDPILASLRPFLRDFAAFAGAKGLKALDFVFLGAVVEGFSLVLLIPLLSVIIDLQNVGGWLHDTATWLFALFSAESRLAKLSLLVTLFAGLMLARIVIITVRDVT